VFFDQKGHHFTDHVYRYDADYPEEHPHEDKKKRQAERPKSLDYIPTIVVRKRIKKSEPPEIHKKPKKEKKWYWTHYRRKR
jgi:hypothetical protein